MGFKMCKKSNGTTTLLCRRKHCSQWMDPKQWMMTKEMDKAARCLQRQPVPNRKSFHPGILLTQRGLWKAAKTNELQPLNLLYGISGFPYIVSGAL